MDTRAAVSENQNVMLKETDSKGAEAGFKESSQPESAWLQEVFRRKKLESVFLFITSQCNSKCRTCFYHDKLNSKDDLTVEEIKRISDTAPKFEKLWISGGEPFLRKEIVEIIKFFYDTNGVRTINLPTNGILTDTIVEKTGRLLDACPELEVRLNFSIDGLGPTHDLNRGVPGNFLKTITTLERVHALYGSNKKLLINVATVITPEGRNDVFELGSYLLEKGAITSQIFEIPRGNPKDPSVKEITADEIKSLRKNVSPLLHKQADNLFKDFNPLGRKIARVFFLGFFKFLNDIQDANQFEPSHWGMKCTAGKTTIVIDHNGDFRSCEMREPIGNLKDYDCNLTGALYSEAMKKEVKEIGGGKKANCWCTHGCWVISSMKFSPRAILWRLPRSYFKFKKYGTEDVPLLKVDMEKIEGYRKG